MNQKGVAPILIVLIIASIIGGYLIYQNQSNPTSLQQTTTSAPSVSPKISTTIQPTNPIKNTSLVSKITSSPTPSPTSSTSPTPTVKPSPEPGVYKLNLQPTTNIEKTMSYNYAASILLTDSNGDTIYDQSDFSFSASIDNPAIADIFLDYGDLSSCMANHIKYEPMGYRICPNYRLDIIPKQTGSTKIPVKAIQKSTGKVVAEGVYSLTIK